jgi:hypothetical protein
MATPERLPQYLYDNLNIARKNKRLAKKCRDAAKEMADSAFNRIKYTKIKINSYSVNSGVVYLQLTAGINAFSSKFTSNHWIKGIDAVGVRGLIDNDFSFQSGSTVNVQYNTGAPNISLTAGLKSAFVYSVDPNKGSLPDVISTDWSTLLKKYGGPEDYREFPDGFDERHDKNNIVPTNKGLGKVDDVTWAYETHRYLQFLERWLQTKTKEFNEANKALQNSRKTTTTATSPKKPTTTGTTTPDKPNSTGNGYVGIGDDRKPVIYNLPAVKEQYFQSTNLKNFKVLDGNVPKAVKYASQLWNQSGAYKGMIQSYIVPGKLSKEAQFFKPQDIKGVDGNRNINRRRYGFQFQYNPSTLTMGYAGAPQVDVGLVTSGNDAVNLIGSGVTSSTINFRLLLNRMNDMKYADAILAGTKPADSFIPSPKVGGLYIPDSEVVLPIKDIYSHLGNHPAQPNAEYGITSYWEEVQAIKELGTMYDLEYLLRSLLGYQLMSSMRNRLSSDIGYLGAYPVELHLGKNLRYLVIIENFSVSHTIFTEDMIPVFTNVDITVSRLPDFAKPLYEFDWTKKTTVKKDPKP